MKHGWFQVETFNIRSSNARQKSPEIARNIPTCAKCKHSFAITHSKDKASRERKPSGSIISIAIPKRKMKVSTDCNIRPISGHSTDNCNIRPISGYIEKVFTSFTTF